jgi:hypothetical protein
MEESLVPNTPPLSEPSQEQVILFELVPESNDENDPALINTLGNQTTTQLQQEGYTVSPPMYSGQKGGFLVELVTAIQQIAVITWDNHAIIAEGIADLSGLVTIFGGLLPVLKRMIQAHQQQVGKAESVARPIKITAEIDGVPLIIEAGEVAQADAVIKLALKYHAFYPHKAAQATAKSKTKIQGQVPARKRRPRR